MSSHNHYYIDLNRDDFETDEKYLEERVKRGLQAGYTFQQCLNIGWKISNKPWTMPPSNNNHQTISKPLTIACRIKADHVPQFGEDVLITFMQKQFTWFIEIKHLTEVWAYGRIFYTSFHSPDLKILFILYLGPDEEQALHMMKTITQQHLYMLSLKELY